MATTWQELKPELIAVLVNAFDEDQFTRLLDFKCEQKLNLLVADRVSFQQKVYEVVGAAALADWLECLVTAAREARSDYTELQRVTAKVLAGIEAEGTTFYKQPAIDEAAGVDDEEVLLRQIHPYLETLQRRTRAVPLTSLDESGKKSGELTLSKIFIGLDVSPESVRAQGAGQEPIHTKSALSYLHENPHNILLGDPGSGKSTLLRYLAYCLAGALYQPNATSWTRQLSWTLFRGDSEIGTEQWTKDIPIPVMVVLRDFARQPFAPDDGTAIVDYVCKQLEPDDLSDCRSPIRELARRGRLMLLLDGVDEVPSDERQAIWDAVKALENGVYGGNRWVATCRILSFDEDEAPSGVPVKTLQPFNENQIEQFIDNWYESMIEAGQLTREQGASKAAALKGAVQKSELRELAENPMLLTIMALVQTFRGTLPEDRAKLYQACVETLLLRWQLRLEEGTDGELPNALQELGTSQEDLERLLWQIAWEAHSKAEDRNRSADIPRWNVLDIAEENLGSLAKAEQFLDYTEQRAHLLVGRGGRRERVYSFPHRTFQEYLAACHLASQRRFPRRAKELARESESWREVLNLAVGTLAFNQQNREKAFDAVEEMVPARVPAADDLAGWRQVWLAGEMCATIGRHAAERDEVGKELLPELRQQLVALLENEALTPQQRAEAGDALGKLGLSIVGIYQIKITGSRVEDLPKNTHFFKDIRFFEEEFDGIMPVEVVIDTKRKNGVAKPATLRRIDQLDAEISEIPELSKPLSIVNLVKYSKQAFYNGLPKYYQLPTSQENTFIMDYVKNSAGNGNLLQSFVDSTGQIARMTTYMRDVKTTRMEEIENDLLKSIDKIFPNERFNVYMTGKALLFLKGTKYLVKNLLLSLALAIGLISIFMAYLFRSFRMVIISLVPNLLPLLITAGLMGYLGVPIKPSTILVFSIAFGISVDDTIHFLAKYRQELVANRWQIKKSVYNALRETGVSMFYTSIVLFFGFSVFIISSFGGTQALGGLVSATLLFAMLSNLILLPSLLLSLERSIANKKTLIQPHIDVLPIQDDSNEKP